jgi:prolyl oligopeptidase
MRLMLAGAMVVLAACASQEMTKVTTAIDREKHLYLEEVEGVEALAWVRSQNDRTLAILENDARFKGYYEAALGIATSKERIPYGSIRQGHVYNFWQDEAHERGLWRRTTPASYASAAPEWETLLDLDALAKAEGANWVYKGVSCLKPEQTRCLLSLSDGGKDAVRVREYSIAEGGAKAGFVAGGFDIPEAKSSIAWQDKDTLLIATDWGNENKDLSGDNLACVAGGRRGQSVVRRSAGGDVLHLELVHLPQGGRGTDAETADPGEVEPARHFCRHAAADAGRGLDA